MWPTMVVFEWLPEQREVGMGGLSKKAAVAAPLHSKQAGLVHHISPPRFEQVGAKHRCDSRKGVWWRNAQARVHCLSAEYGRHLRSRKCALFQHCACAKQAYDPQHILAKFHWRSALDRTVIFYSQIVVACLGPIPLPCRKVWMIRCGSLSKFACIVRCSSWLQILPRSLWL